MKNYKKNKSWFSIIEIIIWIFIFSLWIASVYMLLSSSLNVNNLNKNTIIAWNLAREQLEILKNMRDNNYLTLNNWNYIPNDEKVWSKPDFNKKFIIWRQYTIENDFDALDFPVEMKEISGFVEWKDKISQMENYRLCLDDKNFYTYDCTSLTNKKTNFYRFIKFEKLINATWEISPDAFKVTSKVILVWKRYKEFEIKTIIADFKRL
jgi:hypothetical protein